MHVGQDREDVRVLTNRYSAFCPMLPGTWRDEEQATGDSFFNELLLYRFLLEINAEL